MATASKSAKDKKAAPEKAPASKKAADSKKVVAKTPAQKSPTKKAPAKPAATKPAATKPASKKTAAKPVAKKAEPKKAPAKKAPAKVDKKSSDKAAAAKKGAAKKVTPVKPVKPVKAAKPAKELKPVKETKAAKAAKEAAAKPATPPPPPVQVINPIGGAVIPKVKKAVPGKKAAPKRPVVEEDESKWTKTELNQVRKMLLKEVAELEAEIAAEEERFHALIMESGEGAGDDQADAGAKTFEREHEISILSNKKDLLDQSHHALERIAAGTYGSCENCGKPIGKLRLMEANPRATLCMPCREREDRS